MRQERQRAPGSDVEVLPDVLPEDDRARAVARFAVLRLVETGVRF